MSLRIGLLGTLLVGWGFLAGCASVPPAPSAPNPPVSSNRPAEDPNQGWLLPQTAGQQGTQSSPPGSGVVQTSAVAPATDVPSYVVAAPGTAPGGTAPADSGPLLVPPANVPGATAPPGPPAASYPPGPPAGRSASILPALRRPRRPRPTRPSRPTKIPISSGPTWRRT